MWLDHASDKVEFINAEAAQQRIRYIEQAELVFVITAVINRLAQIDLRTIDNIDVKTTLIPWLAQSTGWPELVARTFWDCLRSPTVHMGHSFALADYKVKTNSGLPVLASLELYDRPNFPTQAEPVFPPDAVTGYTYGDGWTAMHYRGLGEPHFGAITKEHIRVTFWVHDLIEKVRSMVRQVADGIQVAGVVDLKRLSKLNTRLPFLSSPTLHPLLEEPRPSPD